MTSAFLFGVIVLLSTMLAFVVVMFITERKRLRNVTELAEKFAKDLEKTQSQKKSSEVRLGKIGENLAPFTDAWPWDPNNFRFLGSPVDGIQFTDDCIYMVEIKTGNSRLSKIQQRCKELINQGKFKFVEFRIGTDGVEIK